jgi:TatD DNase family protein
MNLVDSHCHIYLEEFTADRPQIIQNALDKGVQKFLLPCIDSSVINDMLLLEQTHANYCYPMMGLHPCYVKENYKDELNIVQQWLQKRNFIAVGEIGLDFYWDTTFKHQQIFCFEQQMQWALAYNIPISIHSREATQLTIDIVKPFAAKGLKGVFHCFTGSYEVAKQIIDMGFLLGIGGVITYKNAGLGAVIEKINTEHLLLETDAPYLSPVPFRGKRNEPAYLEYVVQKIAEIKKVDINEVANVTTKNAERLFSI